MTKAVTLRYKRLLTELRSAASTQIGDAFAALGDYDQAASDRFIAAAVPVSMAAQARASALTAAYLGQVLPDVLGRPVPIPEVSEDDVIGSAVRNGAEPGDVYRRSFVALWGALAAGVALEIAIDAARARLEQAAATDVSLAARATSRDILSAEPNVNAYIRVSSSDGCDLCSASDGDVYAADDLMPIHPHCSCVGEPTAGNPPTSPPESDVVETQEHDELGPLLWAKGGDFATT